MYTGIKWCRFGMVLLRDKKMRWTKDQWTFSMLSDVQELIGMDYHTEAIEKVNDVKRVLQGKYRELEEGCMIEVIKPK